MGFPTIGGVYPILKHSEEFVQPMTGIFDDPTIAYTAEVVVQALWQGSWPVV